MKKHSKSISVREVYPYSIPVNVGCKNGNFYNIISNNILLGKGKTKRGAWASAYKNLNN